MRTLRRKLVRDLGSLRGQVLTVSLVVAAGVAVYVGFQSVFESLERSRDAYYQRYRFADVEVALERAPESVLPRLEALPGVVRAQSRVVGNLRILLPGVEQPPVGLALSLPDQGPALLNALHLKLGRLPDETREDEVVLLAQFAERHQLLPGDTLRVVLEGNAQVLRVVGTVMSPEFVYSVAGRENIGDDSRFAALWMRRKALASLLGLTGAFNDVLVRLKPQASLAEVLERLDGLLAPYGGLGAVERAHQASNAVLQGELDQIRGIANTLPFIFLFVAAFLLNVVLARLVHLQRPQVAALKAVGYSNWAVGRHYLELVLVIVLMGALAGMGLGTWLGDALHGLYRKFFQFPVHSFQVSPKLVFWGFAVSCGAATAGAGMAVRQVVRLPPAEAMRPAAPPSYKDSPFSGEWLVRRFPASARMVVRELWRRPLRTSLSVLGLSLGCGVLVLGRFNTDAIHALMRTLFEDSWREDLAVSFTAPVPTSDVQALRLWPGVERVEGLRMLPVRVRFGARHRDVVALAYPDGTALRGPRDLQGRVVPLPAQGVLLTRQLGELLGVEAGDTVWVEPREGERKPVELEVAGLLDELAGLQLHVRLEAWAPKLGESPTVSMALLQVAAEAESQVVRRLQTLSAVATLSSREATREHMRKQTAESMRVMTSFATLFAVVLAVGVVYNNARVALSMRERDLASMRVLGFTRREISAVLLAELGVQVVAALPLGFWVGRQMAWAVARSVDPERFRVPFTVSTKTYVFAAAVTLLAGLFSALLVRRRLDTLDLIFVLKSRE